MNVLQGRLSALRRRLRLVVTFRGVCWLLTVLLGCAALVGLFDWLLNHWHIYLPGEIRALFLIGTLTGAGYVTYQYLVQPLRTRADNLSLALRVEEQYPVLNDALASTVQFLEQPDDPERTGSVALRNEAVQRALRLAQGCDFNKVIDAQGVRIAGLSFAGCGALALALALFYPTEAWTGLLRLADPFGEHEWPRQTQLRVQARDRIGIGQPYEVKVELSGVIPDEVEIEFKDPGLKPVRFTVTHNETSDVVTVRERLDMTDKPSTFHFRVKANDAVWPTRRGSWHEVSVLPPPELVPFKGAPSPQVVLHYPAYTDLPSPRSLPPGEGKVLDAIAGTSVVWQGQINRPLKAAWLEYLPEDRDVLQVTRLAPLGARHPLAVLSLTAGGYSVWGKTPVQLDPSRQVITATFVPPINGQYVIRILDDESLEQSFPYEVRVVPDPVPTVKLEEPKINRSYLPNAEINLQASAEDEIFAVRSIYLEFRRKSKDGMWLDERPQRVILYHHQSTGAAMAQAMSLGASLSQPFAGLAGMSLPAPGQTPRIRAKTVTATQRWSLRGLVKEGETIVLQACADDFEDVSAFRQPGRSHEVELRIIGKKELEIELAKELVDATQKLIQAKKFQEDALKKVIAAKVQAEKAGKLREEDLNELREAELLQKQVQSILGAKEDEGLRADVAKLLSTIHDNQLPPSDTHDRLKAVRDELERLQHEMSQIEPRLVNARKEDVSEDQVKEKAKLAKAKEDLAKEKDELAKRQRERLVEELAKGFEPSEQLKKTLDEEVKKFLEKEKGAKDFESLKKSLAESPQTKGQLKPDAKLWDNIKEKAPLADAKKSAEEFQKARKEALEAREMAKNSSKNIENRKRDLGLAEKHQKEVDRSLDELLKFMQPWTTLQDLKTKARELLQDQKALQEEAQKFAAEMPPKAKELNEQEHANLKRLEELQKRLAERADKLLHELDTISDKGKQDDPTVKMLKDALNKARADRIPFNMREAAKNIAPLEKKEGEDPPKENVPEKLDKAGTLQDESAKGLEKMVEAMEEKPKDRLDRLRKKQKEAQEDLDRIAKDLDKLRKKVEEANQIKDAEKREQELKKLEAEQRRLEEEAKKRVRELAQLNAGEAGKALDQAARKMDQAAKRLAGGDDPSEDQEEAKKQIEQAKKDLRDAQQETEEELAREQLAKIADKLKGLKERQDDAIDRSVRLHQEMLQQKHWDNVLQKKLRDQKENQLGLGTETEGLQEQLSKSGALVFAHILEKTASAMKRAGQVMEKRYKDATFLQEDFTKEELTGEQKKQDATLALQKEASRRLERLLDVLKKDKKKEKQPENKGGGGNGGGGKQAGGAPGDGIPQIAELKLLRAEQQELKERTAAFAEQHDMAKLTDAQKQELRELSAEQERLYELFQKLTTGAKAEGGNP
jgi:hypothetical protein